MSVDKFFLTEIMLNSKNLHTLQHSEVRSNGDDDCCAPVINQQARTKLKSLGSCHFAHDKHTNA